jgi:hypothetical protein
VQHRNHGGLTARFSLLPLCAKSRHRAALASHNLLSTGIVHVPSIIDGSFSFGQYIRNIRMNLPVGAGSQFESLLAPGEVFTGTSPIFAKRATSGASAAGVQGNASARAVEALPWMLSKVF